MGAKIDEKSKKIDVKKTLVLRYVFSWIFFDFGGQNGGKLGGKIEPRANKKAS